MWKSPKYSFEYCQAGILIFSRKVTDLSEFFLIFKVKILCYIKAKLQINLPF